MNDEHVRLDRQAWERFKRHIRVLWHSEAGGQAFTLFALLIAFLIAINGLNVVNSYVGRDFMTAIAERNQGGFVQNAIRWIAVFAAATVVSVVSRYVEEYLALLWRRYLTARAVRLYASHRIYFQLGENGEIGNPDQRIADDIKAFTTTTVSFMLMLINSSFTILAFSGVLWSISPLLLTVAVLYAVLGSYITVRLGRPLVHLNFDQLDKEAEFRSSLIYLKENADAVAFSRREFPLTRKLLQRLDELADNLRVLIGVNRKVGFFTTFYSWLIQIIPALFVAPLFIAGDVEFGVITQSAMAFTTLVGAFSLFVTQFQSISSFAAVLARLSSFSEAMEHQIVRRVPPITVTEVADQIAYSGLTLRSPRSGRILVADLTASVSRGQRVLITGSDETARAALYRATAGLWDRGQGQIVRPVLDQILFVNERPFLPSSTLRDLLLPPLSPETPEDALILTGAAVRLAPFPQPQPLAEQRFADALTALGLESLPARFGGWDRELDWSEILPLAEQQMLVFARVLLAQPAFVLLDRPATALGPDQLDRALAQLTRHAIGYLVFAERADRPDRYDARLELMTDGKWRWQRAAGNAGRQ